MGLVNEKMQEAVTLAVAEVVKGVSFLVTDQLPQRIWGEVITFPSSILLTRTGGGGLHSLTCTQLPEMYFSPGGADITALFSFPLNNPSGSHPSFVNNSLEVARTLCLLELAVERSDSVRGDRCSVPVLGPGGELQHPAAAHSRGALTLQNSFRGW